jgi:CRP-like cAMP-binding protein
MPVDSADIVDAFFERYRPKLTETAILLLTPNLKVLHHPKKHELIKANQTSGYAYLLVKGAARSYYLYNGTEINSWFAFENEMVGSLRNYNNLPSRETIELLEDSTLLSFNVNGIKPLMAENIEISNFINQVIGEYCLYLEDKLFYTHLRSARERYTALLAQEPNVFKRVPLTYIASFLGISRETLSRLRAK